jgi:hypothetical protein
MNLNGQVAIDEDGSRGPGSLTAEAHGEQGDRPGGPEGLGRRASDVASDLTGQDVTGPVAAVHGGIPAR